MRTALLFLLLCSISSIAQSPEGAIAGVVTDRSRARGTRRGENDWHGTLAAYYRNQVDLRVSRNFKIKEHMSLLPFIEFYNLLNRQNPGNNFVGDIGALPVPPAEVAAGNVTDICLTADCSVTRPIHSLKDLRVPAGALGDFFGPGTTVGIPFSAQVGARFTF